MTRSFLFTALVLATPAAAQTQAQMNRAAVTAYQTADAAMARQWQRTYAAMKRRDAQDTSRGGGFGYAAGLLASQRAWLAFRDAQCVVEGGEFARGSLQATTQTRCKIRLTGERRTQLAQLLWNR